MSILKKTELFDKIKNRIEEDNSDEALSLLEDLADTLEDYDTRLSDTTDWKSKYEENDAAWRTRYKERFFDNSTNDDELPVKKENDPENQGSKIQINDLFK